jgi:hypothetical protein
MTKEGIDYQLVPPGVHRCNAPERAIHMFKNRFIAGLCSTDKNFPPPPVGSSCPSSRVNPQHVTRIKGSIPRYQLSLS